MTIKFEYLIHPGQTVECAYKLDKLMFQARVLSTGGGGLKKIKAISNKDLL